MFRTLLLLTVLSGIVFQARGEWSFYLVNNASVTPAIRLDFSGTPSVVYARDPYIKYSILQGHYWVEENVHQSSSGGSGWPSLASDAQDVPHVSFSSGGVLFYAVMNREDRSWTVWNLYPASGTWTSIALTPGGAPCISWYSFAKDLRFIVWTGGGWAQETVDQSADAGACNSMAVDGAGVAHIAYCQFQPFPAVRYARREAPGNWQTFVVDSSMSYVMGTSLALDGSGHPRMSYSADGETRYAFWDGSTWTVQTVYSTDTGAYAYGTSLALDKYGYPHIAHCDKAAFTLLYSVNQGGGWQTETVGSPGGNNGDPSLAIDSQVRPHIAFIRDGKLYYAFNDEPAGIGSAGRLAVEAGFMAGPNPFNHSLSIRFDLQAPSLCEARVHDLAGRVVGTVRPGQLGPGAHSISWTPEPHLPSGQYIVTLDAGGTRHSRRVLLLR